MKLANRKWQILFLLLALAGAGVGLASWASTVEAKAPLPAKPEPVDLADRLDEKIKFQGFADQTTLEDALKFLSDKHNLNFEINFKAFQEQQVNEVEKTALAEGRPVPNLNNVPLSKVLRTLLARIPSESPAMYIIRDDTIEITTEAAVRAELGRGDAETPLLPLVRLRLDRMPLDDALKLLARKTGFNILVDARINEKAKLPVSANLNNVPLDTAVRLLADMAALQPVKMDNILYVTSRENAHRLEQEEQQRKWGGLGGIAPTPTAPPEPAPAPNPQGKKRND